MITINGRDKQDSPYLKEDYNLRFHLNKNSQNNNSTLFDNPLAHLAALQPEIVNSPHQSSNQGYFVNSSYRNSLNQHNIVDLKTYNSNQQTLKEASRNFEREDLNQYIRERSHYLSTKNCVHLNHRIDMGSLPNQQSEIMNAAHYMVQKTNIDPVGVYIQILATISIATLGRVDICPNKTWKESSVSMIVQVAPAGSRKSSIIEMLRKPFNTFCNKKNEIFEIDKEKSLKLKKVLRITDTENNKRLAKKIKEYRFLNVNTLADIIKENDEYEENMHEVRSKIKTFSKVQILVDSVTPFALRKILSEQGGSCGCITAESEMFQGQFLSKKADPAFFNKLYTQEQYVKATKLEDIILEHPSFSMINFIQANGVKDFYKDEQLNNLGVTARFMPYFHVGDYHNQISSYYDDNGFHGRIARITHPIPSKDKYEQVINRMLDMYYTQDANAERFEVTVTPEAYQLIKDFEYEINQSVIPNMPSVAEPCLRKLHGQAVRFAWCIHAWNTDKPHCSAITATEMSQAIGLCSYSLPHIKYAYDPCGLQAYEDAIKIIVFFNNINVFTLYDGVNDNWLDTRTIQQRAHLKAPQVENALRLLAKHNAVAIVDRGRRNNVVVLHPNFYGVQWY